MIEIVGAADEMNILSFYRAIEDKGDGNVKHPTNYNHLVIPLTKLDAMHYYVDPLPAYVMPRGGIESVRVGKSVKITNPQKSGGNTERNKAPEDFFYTLNLKLTPKEAKQFIAFVNKNKDKAYQMKIGGHSLGVTEFYWPMEVNEVGKLEFTIMSREGNANTIRTILVPLKDKVTWE
jgi:hypothetical protein